MNSASNDETSVIVVVKDGESTLSQCLAAVLQNNPLEVIVVAATESRDATIEVAKSFAVHLIETTDSCLAADRQRGIDEARGARIFMVDADHVLDEGAIERMNVELGGLDACQAGLQCSDNARFWQQAESDYWNDYHNHPHGVREMIGTAPTLFRREVFDKVRFSDTVSGGADDTDFMYRLRRTTSFVVGVVPVTIRQLHNSSFKDYVRKFFWYGKGDWEFISHYRNRALAHFWHISVRHIVVRSLKSAIRLRWKSAIFVIVMGAGRTAGAFMAALSEARNWAHLGRP